MSKRPKKILHSLALLSILLSIFIFGINLSFAQKSVNSSNTTVKSTEINNKNIDSKLLEVANIKLDIANEKEDAYDKAINQLKLYLTFYGSFLILIAIGFGFYKDNKITEAKDELLNSIEEKKKYLEETNSLNMDKRMFELEKNNIIKIDEIKKLTLSDVEDLQQRIRNLELGKSDFENKNINENNQEEVFFEDKNPYE